VSVMFVTSTSCMVMVSIAGLCGGFSSFVSRVLYSGFIFSHPALSLYWMRFCWASAFATLTVCSMVRFSFSAISLMLCHVSSFSRSKKSFGVANGIRSENSL